MKGFKTAREDAVKARILGKEHMDVVSICCGLAGGERDYIWPYVVVGRLEVP